jgi:RNA polymerase sigma-70 factor (ECF subfamily)
MHSYDLGLMAEDSLSTIASMNFEASLATHLPFLRARALAMIRQRDLAEDMVQEAAAKAWEYRQSFVLGTNMRAWLATILRNLFYSHQRRQWRQAPWRDELDNTLCVPPDEQKWSIELSEVACAMNSLSRLSRDTMILVSICSFSYEETSSLFTVAVGTVKSRVSRAREAITAIRDRGTSRPSDLHPANGNSLADWVAQIDRLEDFALQALKSGDFGGFAAHRKTPEMAAINRAGLRGSILSISEHRRAA